MKKLLAYLFYICDYFYKFLKILGVCFVWVFGFGLIGTLVYIIICEIKKNPREASMAFGAVLLMLIVMGLFSWFAEYLRLNWYRFEQFARKQLKGE